MLALRVLMVVIGVVNMCACVAAQEVLRKRGLTVSGNKADLIVRILQAQAPQATRR